MKNSYVSCITQYENLGDLIINKMLVDELSRYGKVYLDTYRVPETFSTPLLQNDNVIDMSTLQLHYKGRRSLLPFLNFYIRHKISVITECPGPMYPQKRRGCVRALTLLYDSLLKIFGIHRYLIGNCCSHLRSTKTKYEGPNYDGYYMRSRQSANYLSKYVSSNKVQYIPDLCYLLKYQATQSKKNKIAIFDIRAIDKSDKKLFTWCKEIANEFLLQGYEVVLYYQVEKDYDDMMNLYKYIGHSEIKVRSNLLWYDDLEFYSDKMFVVSNRLHSLLIGAAYSVFPICLYEDRELTAKLKDVFHSSFSKELPVFYENGDKPNMPFEQLYESYSIQLNNEYAFNAELCRNTIETLMKK